MTKKEEDLIGNALEDWSADENTPSDMDFVDWVKLRRPELLPLLDKLPEPSRPLPTIEADDPH